MGRHTGEVQVLFLRYHELGRETPSSEYILHAGGPNGRAPLHPWKGHY